MPIWVQYVQALGSIFIAIVAAFIASNIAWRQWKTAQSKVVLDLFEHRMAVYDDLRKAMPGIIASSAAADEMIFVMHKAMGRVPVLFGPEVQKYLSELQKDIFTIADKQSSMETLAGVERDEAVKIKHETLRKVRTSFYDEFPKLIAPYIDMHQKLP